MEETIRTIALTIFAGASLSGIIKWGIDKYFKKSEEVMKLKEDIQKKTIETIEKTMNNVAKEIINHGDSMVELEQHLTILNSRLQDYDNQNIEVMKISADINRRLKIFENLELYEFKENTFIFRKKTH